MGGNATALRLYIDIKGGYVGDVAREKARSASRSTMGGKMCPGQGRDGQVGPPGAILQASGLRSYHRSHGKFSGRGGWEQKKAQIFRSGMGWIGGGTGERDEHMPPARLFIHTNTKFYAYARASLRLRPAMFKTTSWMIWRGRR